MDTSRKITRLKVTTTHTIKPPMPTLLHSASWQLSTSCCVKVVFEAQRSLLAVFFQNVLMMGAKIILFLRTHKLFTIILRTHSSDIDFLHICLPTLCTLSLCTRFCQSCYIFTGLIHLLNILLFLVYINTPTGCCFELLSINGIIFVVRLFYFF